MVACTVLCSSACSGYDKADEAMYSAMQPVVATTIGTQRAVAGEPIALDVTLAGKAFAAAPTAFRYRAVAIPAVAGTTFANGAITGVPTTPGVSLVSVTAFNNRGDSAVQQFRLVVFAAGLPVPATQPVYSYNDAQVPIPGHFALATAGSVIPTDNTPPDNPVTDAGAALGRILFYDRRLSANDQVSCSSCHQQAFGFSDTARFSRGLKGARTAAHSMALANARYYRRGRFFWDERASSLEAQVLQPVQDTIEMGMTLEDLEAKLTVTDYYPALFEAAFGTQQITRDRIARALAQFVRSMLSANARFDAAFTTFGSPDFSFFTQAEQEGQQLFISVGCASCHRTNAHVSDGPSNTGLDADAKGGVDGIGAFKAPSLRNVSVRRPYMHDGRFATLDQVVAFYDSGVQFNQNLERRLRNADGVSARRLNLSASQRAAIVAYLGTLTDSAFLTAPRFGNPFKQ